MRLLVPCVLLVALAACRSDGVGSGAEGAPEVSEPVTAGPGQPPMGPPMDPRLEGFRPGVSLAELLDPALDTPALLARLDEPRRIETEAVENRHVPGQVDTLRTYVYDGLALTVYDVAGGGALLQEVRVTDEGYTTAGGLGVGSRREAIEAAYPNSVGAEGGTVTYERAASPDDPTPETLRVRYDGDRAAELVWSFYVD